MRNNPESLAARFHPDCSDLETELKIAARRMTTCEKTWPAGF